MTKVRFKPSRRAVYKITVDGKDISQKLGPILISFILRMDDENSADELHLVLDDSYGQIALPSAGATITASIGWSDKAEDATFEGTVDEINSADAGKHQGLQHRYGRAINGLGDGLHSAGSRSKGRVLTITAKSVDTGSKVKQRTSAHVDGGSFADAVKKFGQAVGIDVQVDQALSSVQRGYWGIAAESPLEWGTRFARELGGTFKMFGTTGVFTSRAGGSSVTGQTLGTVHATWGNNLLEWDITPVMSRPSFASFVTRWYDNVEAVWKAVTHTADGTSTTGSDVEHTSRFKAGSQTQAQGQSGSNAAESARESGGGDYVTIDGEPIALPTGPCAVSGIRPGVDGTYLISTVTHMLSRDAGFTTQLSLKQPSGGAGTDDRQESDPAG